MKTNPRDYKNIVILTGAGISADSGIATFRDANGLWEQHRIEDVATPEAFRRDPKLVWKFYSLRRAQAATVEPNAAHHALVSFAKNFSGQVTLITQNVDDLHHRADPTEVLPPICMHGSLHYSRCERCGTLVVDQKQYMDEIPQTNCCKARLRPHIVWFGEMPLFMDEIQERLEEADLFVSIGTSGQVYPAAGFLEVAKYAGARTVCINKDPIPQMPFIDEFIQGRAVETVPLFFR